MNGLVARRMVQVANLCSRNLTTTYPCLKKAQEVQIANYEKLKKKQEHFQLDSDVPVYLKGGMFDRVLYHITIGIGVVGFALASKFMYESAYPKK